MRGFVMIHKHTQPSVFFSKFIALFMIIWLISPVVGIAHTVGQPVVKSIGDSVALSQSVPPNILPAPGTALSEVHVYVNSTIVSSLTTSLNQYVADGLATGYNVTVISWSDTNVVNLRNTLAARYNAIGNQFGGQLSECPRLAAARHSRDPHHAASVGQYLLLAETWLEIGHCYTLSRRRNIRCTACSNGPCCS